MATGNPVFWTVGCLSSASAVMLGAFGAHGLRSRGLEQRQLNNWATAAQYHLIHSLALLLTEHAAPRNLWAKRLFTAGILGFSGSLYCLVLDPVRFKIMGPVTPLGGSCLIAGWVALAVVSRGRSVGKVML